VASDDASTAVARIVDCALGVASDFTKARCANVGVEHRDRASGGDWIDVELAIDLPSLDLAC